VFPRPAVPRLALMEQRLLVLGHRGASHARPENTLAAFAKAREFGADGVELDARRTADGELVVHHDPSVDGFGLIVAEPLATLRAAHPEIPTLAEVLEACAGMIVNVEVKCLPWEPDADTPDHVVVRAVVELLRANPSGSIADVIVSSFDLDAIDACRSFAPEIATAWLTNGREVSAGATTAVEHGHAWLNPDRVTALRASRSDIDGARDSGLRLNVWTVDEPAEITALAAAGVDGIITNVPDIAVATLKEGEVKGRRFREQQR
jgi:glycerophosphoryl diester phosphodiesterase